MAEGATSLADLLGNAPVQQTSQATAFTPMVGGGDPFIAPQPAAKLVNHSATFASVRVIVKNTLTYVAFFIAAVVISLPVPRALFLQYIPNTYTSGGVVSYYGAGILGAISVAIAYVVSTFLSSLI